MEKETEVDWTKPEAKKLFRRVRLQGLSNDDIRRIIADADTPQAAFDRLTEIADPRRVCPKTPKPPPYERELDPHEETALDEILAGELPSHTTV